MKLVTKNYVNLKGKSEQVFNDVVSTAVNQGFHCSSELTYSSFVSHDFQGLFLQGSIVFYVNKGLGNQPNSEVKELSVNEWLGLEPATKEVGDLYLYEGKQVRYAGECEGFTWLLRDNDTTAAVIKTHTLTLDDIPPEVDKHEKLVNEAYLEININNLVDDDLNSIKPQVLACIRDLIEAGYRTHYC